MIFPKGLASSQSQEKYVISFFLALPVKRGIGTVSRCKVGPDGESPPQGWDGVGGLRDGMHWLCCCCFDCCLQFHRFSLKFPLEWLKIPKFSRLRRKKNPARYARHLISATLTATIIPVTPESPSPPRDSCRLDVLM